MRSIWNGSIAFGGVSIPVKAYPATEEHTSGLHQAHQHDGGRVKVKRVCELDNAEVPYPEVVKGYELPGGDVVLLTDEDLATLPLPTTRSIEVCAFTPLEQVDPIYFGKSYYLEPEPAGTKPYVLFSEAATVWPGGRRQGGAAAAGKPRCAARAAAGDRAGDHAVGR